MAGHFDSSPREWLGHSRPQGTSAHSDWRCFSECRGWRPGPAANLAGVSAWPSGVGDFSPGQGWLTWCRRQGCLRWRLRLCNACASLNSVRIRIETVSFARRGHRFDEAIASESTGAW